MQGQIFQLHVYREDVCMHCFEFVSTTPSHQIQQPKKMAPVSFLTKPLLQDWIKTYRRCQSSSNFSWAGRVEQHSDRERNHLLYIVSQIPGSWSFTPNPFGYFNLKYKGLSSSETVILNASPVSQDKNAS